MVWVRSLILAWVTFLWDDIIIINLWLLLANLLLLFLLNILVFLEISVLVSILVDERMLLWLLWVIDVNVEVLGNVLNVVVLNGLPVLMSWLDVVITVVLVEMRRGIHVVCYILVLIVREVLLVVLEVTLSVRGLQVWI